MSSTIPSKEWMTANHATVEYIEGLHSFIKFAKENVEDPDWCCCPCVNCRNLKKHSLVIIMEHLFCDGIDKSYTIWKHHGESSSNSHANLGTSTTSTSSPNKDKFSRMEDMLNNTFGGVCTEDLHACLNDAYDEDDEQRPHDLHDDAGYNNQDRTVYSHTYREKGRSSREKMISPHTTGRRGASKMAEELKMQNPTGIVTRTELFIATHTKKDGTCPSQFMTEILDEIKKMVEDNSVEGEAILDDDPVAHVFGRDRRGYVRGMGRGISKTTFSSSAPSREIASREKRARESVESNCEAIMRRLDEESKARKVLEEKFNALPRYDSSHGTRMTRSSDQLSSSYQERRQSSVHLDSPIEELPSQCILKNFKNKNVAMGRVDKNASQSNLSYTIIVDDIYDITAELYARDGTLGDITPGDIITWPKSLVYFS